MCRNGFDLRNVVAIATCLAVIAIFSGCSKENELLEGITMDNYPRVDCSTSTAPLNLIIAAKLLGLKYEWTTNEWLGVRDVTFKNYDKLPLSFTEKLRYYQTHSAIINLIDNQKDLIIVARKMSADEKQYADNAGVSLIETPIALDALDFIINVDNPVNSLTVEQIQNIYLGNITNWSEIGGGNEAIVPFIRNENSGSQEMMNEIVMNSIGMPDWDVSYADELTIYAMLHVYLELLRQNNGICYTPHYYKENMVCGVDEIKTLAVNGIRPDGNSLKNRTYPFVAPVYVAIRSDVDRNSMTYKLYEWLQTGEGKRVIRESGYVTE